MDILDSQKNVLEILKNSKKQNRLSHAYMFEGPKGVGKLEVALYFICMLWCDEEEPCLSCNTCKQILNKQFLNLVYIKPTKNIIPVEDINNLQREFSSKAALEGPRFYIIDDADKMSVKVQNKLLKFIEEPSSGNFAILLTTDADNIITTIKSRVITLSLKELSYNFLIQKLSLHKIDEKYLRLLPHIENSEEKCLDLLNNTEVIEVLDLVYSFIELLTQRKITFFYDKYQNILSDNKKSVLFLNLLEELFKDIYCVMISKFPQTFTNIDYDILKTLYKVSYISEIVQELVELESKLRYNISINLHYVKLITVLNGGVIR